MNAGTREGATMTRLAVLLLALGAYTGVLAASQGIAAKTQPHGSALQNSTQSDQRGTEQSPLAIELVQSKASEEQAVSEAKNAENQTAAIIEANKITRWLAGATIALAIFALWQVIESRRSSRRQMEIAIAQQQATVLPLTLHYHYYPIAKTRPRRYEFRFRLQLRNNGTTPTKNLRMKAHCILSNQLWDMNTVLDYGPHVEGTGLIPPQFQLYGGLAPMFPDPAITGQDILDVQAGTKFLYVLGWIVYNDIFPGTPVHVTRYCWSVIPMGDPLASTPKGLEKLRFDWVQHATGNTTEDIKRARNPLLAALSRSAN